MFAPGAQPPPTPLEKLPSQPPPLPTSRPPRARGEPVRLAHEQEDAALHAQDMAMVLQAMRHSLQLVDGLESDSSNDSEDDDVDYDNGQPPVAEGGLCNEAQLVATLSLAEQKDYDERREEEEKTGWTTVHSNVVHAHAFIPPPQGPYPALNGCSTPLDFFHAILPVDFFTFLVERMNEYTALRRRQQNENRAPAQSTRTQPQPLASWSDTSVREVLAFVGCMICMGMCNMYNTRSYWSAPFTLPFVGRTFTRDRFMDLLRCFHMADSSNPGILEDRIRKIRELNDRIITQSQSVYFRQHGSLVVTSWVDRKPVNLLSTYCDPVSEDEVQRWRRSSARGRRDRRVRLTCPQVLVQYHHWMRGVDVWSQKESYNRIGRKSRRWWPRLAWFLIDMAVSNAHVLYLRYVDALSEPKPSHASAASQHEFRCALMTAPVGTFTARKKRGRPSHTPKVREGEVHIPRLHMPQRPCVVCAPEHTTVHGGHKPRTTEGCETCGVAVHIACWKAHLPAESKEDNEAV